MNTLSPEPSVASPEANLYPGVEERYPWIETYPWILGIVVGFTGFYIPQLRKMESVKPLWNQLVRGEDSEFSVVGREKNGVQGQNFVFAWNHSEKKLEVSASGLDGTRVPIESERLHDQSVISGAVEDSDSYVFVKP
jgi:hypothetical protein